MSKIAFIYPGQGAQKVGMGQAFYENNEAAKQVFEQASQLLDLDMAGLCFTENNQLDQTEYTQAALVTTCLAISEVIMKNGIIPDVTAGLSLGEYTAIAVAGGMTNAEAITTVRRRGILMQEAVPSGEGTMTAVLGMSGEKIQDVIADLNGVSVANYNCPGQVVITGITDGIRQAETLLKEAGAKRVIPLNVSGPFHSKMLEPAGKKLQRTLDTVFWKSLNIPYVTNVTADYIYDVNCTQNLLVEQVSESVCWEQSIRTMIENDVDTFIEIGPGKTLTGFLKKINRNVTMYNIETPEDMDIVLEKLKV